MLPPVTIKNCLPCSLDIAKADKIDFNEDGVETEGFEVYNFGKQEEKHMHIFKYLEENSKDYIYLRFRINGYKWGIERFKRKQIGRDIEEDKDVKIKDKELVGSSICVRVM